MDKVILLKAEIFDIQVQLEQLVNSKNQKLQQLQDELRKPKATTLAVSGEAPKES